MVAIIAPAKRIRPYSEHGQITVPVFSEEAEQIVEAMRRLEPWEMESVLRTNEKIALEAYINYQSIGLDVPGTQALFAYDGLVYKNIIPESFDEDELDFINQKLRILSAVYGVLRPSDGILPYRLEMNCSLSVNGTENLYRFWGNKLHRELYCSAAVVVNLASEEYAKAVRKHLRPQDTWIDVIFLSCYKGKLKTLPAWAKMARGQMVRYIVKNRLETPEQLKKFCWDGYHFEACLSERDRLIFVRN